MHVWFDASLHTNLFGLETDQQIAAAIGRRSLKVMLSGSRHLTSMTSRNLPKRAIFSLQGSDQSQLVADLRADITTLLAGVTHYRNAGQLVQEADAYLSQVGGIPGRAVL